MHPCTGEREIMALGADPRHAGHPEKILVVLAAKPRRTLSMRALQLIEDRKLETVDLPPPPPPGIGEVTVSVKAVALNHIDVWGWRGMAFAKRKMPLVIGAEASGTVDAIGQGVAGLVPGQLVSIYGARTCGLCRPCREGRDNLCEHVSGVHGFHLDGFAQEKVNLPARLLVPAPPGVSPVGAAVAPVTFGTVEHMLFDNAKLEPGETILIHAGGSGIGSAAIQLAKKIGCTVITTVGSDAKIEPAKALGADHVINYREDRFEGVVRKLTKKRGVDVVFEHVGADTWAGSMLSLKRGGRLVTCGSTSGVSTQMNLMMLFQQQLKLLGSFGCRMENMADAMQKMAAGLVHPVIDTEVGFDDIDTALARMEGRDVFGKIILRMD
jgi:alcohol dehydrogenase